YITWTARGRMIHSLHYFYTASSGLSTFPEFVAVGMLDEVQIGYYDSNSKRIVMRQDWMEQFLREHPGELERNTGRALGAQHSLKAEIVNLKRAFNQTGGTFISNDRSALAYRLAVLQLSALPPEDPHGCVCEVCR
uniref:MHC class I-like antigen recognition-like domain-containing protein n=1 Tax=Gadus morhua TaxID=8049 RepID=A0A8C5AFS6_GADMO